MLIIKKKIKTFLSNNSFREIKLFSSDFSENDSKENLSKIKKMRSQGFDVDIENSDDSLDKVQSLIKTIGKNLVIKKNEKIYLHARSKSFKNIDTFLIKYSPVKKPKKVKLAEIYNINKKYLRTGKRKKTEVEKDRNKVIIIEDKKSKKKVKKDKKDKKDKKEEQKKTLINKRKNIDEIKKILLINDVGKNNKVLDVVKRGFLFINNNESNYKNTDTNKKLLTNSYQKTSIKPNKNKINTNNEIKIKQKIIKFTNKFNTKNYYNGENYNLFKNRKIIFKNLNDSLNEYRFYNKILHNSLEKQKFYEKKLIPGLFTNKIDGLLENINNKSNIRNIIQSLGNLTPIHKKYILDHSYTICKKFNKTNNNFLNIKIANNISLLSYNNKKNSVYNIDNSSWENSKILCNKMERLENCIYKYYKTNNEVNNKLISEQKLKFYTINKSEINNSNNKKKNKNIIKNNTSKRKIESYYKNNKEELFILPLNNRNNEKNAHDYLSIKAKSISRNSKNLNNNQKSNKIRFYDAFKNKKRHLILSQC